MDKPEIVVKCCNCGRWHLVTINFHDPEQVICLGCKEMLLDYMPIKGYVYMLSNSKMPNLYKIGFTKRTVDDRIKELNNHTGIPAPFEVEALFPSLEPEKHESLAHEMLDEYRLFNREFFECDLIEAIKTIKLITGTEPVYLKDGNIFDILCSAEELPTEETENIVDMVDTDEADTAEDAINPRKEDSEEYNSSTHCEKQYTCGQNIELVCKMCNRANIVMKAPIKKVVTCEFCGTHIAVI